MGYKKDKATILEFIKAGGKEQLRQTLVVKRYRSEKSSSLTKLYEVEVSGVRNLEEAQSVVKYLYPEFKRVPVKFNKLEVKDE